MYTAVCCRLLQSEGECSLTVRDGSVGKTAREWLSESCDFPEYMDPFGRDADLSEVHLKKPEVEEEPIDNSKIRIFLFMKEKPSIDIEESAVRPPWDISTNVNVAPKYLKNGSLNPERFRPSSALSCDHFSGPPTVRPFSAPCGYPEFSSWKHPIDVQPFLSVAELDNFRQYSSVTDLSSVEANPLVREKAEKLLTVRSSYG